MMMMIGGVLGAELSRAVPLQGQSHPTPMDMHTSAKFPHHLASSIFGPLPHLHKQKPLNQLLDGGERERSFEGKPPTIQSIDFQ